MSVRIGLALGGGAARGLAHLGVLEILLGAGIRPHVIVGTSFGALAGAAVVSRGLTIEATRAVIAGVSAYAHGEAFRKSKLGMFRRQRDVGGTGGLTIREVVKRGVHSPSLPDVTLVPSHEVRAAIEAIVPDVAIESLPCAFGAIAADLATGDELLFDAGSLRLAIRGSCAIPGLMEPVPVSGRLTLDGGWAEKVPAGPARLLGAECVIAVDVADELADTASMTSGLNVAHRGDAIRSHRLKLLQLRDADAVLACDLGRFGWADFELAADIIEAGRAAAREALPRIADVVERSSTLRVRASRFVESWGRKARGSESSGPVRVAAVP